MNYPKLRPVEAIVAQDNRICLRDPQGFSDKLLIVPRDVLFICTLFDGRHSILDIQTEYTRRFGDLLFSDRVEEIVEQLDRCLFLENDNFSQAKARALAAFRAAPTRPAFHAGTAYEEEPEKLLAQLDAYFSAAEGPGLPGPESPSGRLQALIAPHIDLRRGSLCYAWSYAELFNACRATTFVILGISHTETERRFTLTDKDFDTPLGILPVDGDFMAALKERCRVDFFVDEFAHRNEHSVEFQVLLLRYLYRRVPEIRIVPILCSSLQRILLGHDSPREDEEVAGFVQALKAVIRERGDQVCCIAGVDLSHVGRRFGQSLEISPALLQDLEREDREMLQLVLDRDAEAFIQSVRQDKDRRNVCGVPAIYALLNLLGRGESRLVRYDQAVDPQTQSVVTFAGAAFYR